METERKIGDYIPVLYNIIFYSLPDSCASKVCRTNKCICMDMEQTGLLRKILSQDDQIAMNIDAEPVIFINLENEYINGLACEDAVSIPGRELCFRKNRCSKEEFERILNGFAGYRNNFADVWKTIPVVYMINTLETIQERNTLIYLCAYASCPERYLYILFRAAICRTILCCEDAVDDAEKQQYANKLAKLFCKLDAVFEGKRDGQIGELEKIIDEYILECRNDRRFCNMSQVRNMVNLLENYKIERKDLWPGVSAYELARCGKLYKLLIKILQTANIDTKEFPKLKFIKKMKRSIADSTTEYDVIIHILDTVRYDQAKLSEILSEVAAVFKNDVDVPSESIERMEEIVKAS